jgi:2-polyprenyl-3-methyl-5-hydroxy-6-metoxy-1,4-benzoquinol methylase
MTCRICNSSDLRLYYTQGNERQFKYYKCQQCSLVNYDLTGGNDQGKYTATYIDPRNTALKTNRDQLKTYLFIKRNVKNIGTYLDIGCGNGCLLMLARNDGWQVRGLELSSLYASSIKETLGIDVDVANFLDLPDTVTKQYNLVSMRHVLEHIPDAITAMTKIGNLLLPGGFVVLEFPNIESIEAKNKRFLERIGIRNKKYVINYMPGHCNEFCRSSFAYLAQKTGFEIIRWETYSTNAVVDAFYRLIPVGTKVRVLIKKK